MTSGLFTYVSCSVLSHSVIRCSTSMNSIIATHLPSHDHEKEAGRRPGNPAPAAPPRVPAFETPTALFPSRSPPRSNCRLGLEAAVIGFQQGQQVQQARTGHDVRHEHQYGFRVSAGGEVLIGVPNRAAYPSGVGHLVVLPRVLYLSIG
jgi:hypothetical protein